MCLFFLTSDCVWFICLMTFSLTAKHSLSNTSTTKSHFSQIFLLLLLIHTHPLSIYNVYIMSLKMSLCIIHRNVYIKTDVRNTEYTLICSLKYTISKPYEIIASLLFTTQFIPYALFTSSSTRPVGKNQQKLQIPKIERKAIALLLHDFFPFCFLISVPSHNTRQVNE